MHRAVVWIQAVLVPALGPAGLFVVAFLDSSILSLPEVNDILVIASSAAHPERAWFYASSTAAGSVAGCCVLWFVGRRGGEALLVRRFGRQGAAHRRRAWKRGDVLALAIPA